MKLRAMSYNIQSGRDAFGRLDLRRAESEIHSLAPDVCALNEVRVRTADIGETDQAKALGEKLNMRWTFAKAIDYMGGAYGIALLSRFPILCAEAFAVPEVPDGLREARYEARALLRCELDTEAGRIAAYVSHFGLSNAEWENATEFALSKLRKEALPALFMGDLNMTPEDPLIGRLRAQIPDTAENSRFFTYGACALSKKIDYIFADARFRTVQTRAPYSVFSDHLPIVADLEY